jgi:ATPase subunit of ABC transporter with duplicated ATPase domains
LSVHFVCICPFPQPPPIPAHDLPILSASYAATRIYDRIILDEEKRNYAAAVVKRDQELAKHKADLAKIEKEMRAKEETMSRFLMEKKEREDLARRVTTLTKLKSALESYNASSGAGAMSPENVAKALSEALTGIDNNNELLNTIDQDTLSVASEIDELQRTVGSADDSALEEEKEDAIDDLLDEIEDQKEMYLWIKGERDRVQKSAEDDDDEIDF